MAGTAEPLNGGAGTPILPEILAPGLDVVFIGAAPSPAAAASGHYYAGRRNRFWDLLYQSGFTPYRLDASEDQSVLRYGIGLTAVYRDRISTANSLLPVPAEDHVHGLMERVIGFAPLIVCYNGKDVCRMCTSETNPSWGVLDDTPGHPIEFVVPSSSGRADRWGAERLSLFRELYALIRQLRASVRTRETSAIAWSVETQE